MRKFCNVPGEILNKLFTSEDFSHFLGCSSFLLVFISSTKKFRAFSKSNFVTCWCFKMSRFSVSGNSFFKCRF